MSLLNWIVDIGLWTAVVVLGTVTVLDMLNFRSNNDE